MNKQTFITALFALVAIVANAQQRLTVRDSLTQEPIAYTSVWFGNGAGGYKDESARAFYKGRIPNAKLGLEISTLQ